MKAKGLIALILFGIAGFAILHRVQSDSTHAPGLTPETQVSNPGTMFAPRGPKPVNPALHVPVKPSPDWSKPSSPEKPGNFIKREAERLARPALELAIKNEISTREVIYDKVNSNGYQTFIVKFYSLSPEEVLRQLNTANSEIDALGLSHADSQALLRAVTNRIYELADSTFPHRFLFVASKTDGSEPLKATYFETIFGSPFIELPNGGIAIKDLNSSSRILKPEEVEGRFSHLIDVIGD